MNILLNTNESVVKVFLKHCPAGCVADLSGSNSYLWIEDSPNVDIGYRIVAMVKHAPLSEARTWSIETASNDSLRLEALEDWSKAPTFIPVNLMCVTLDTTASFIPAGNGEQFSFSSRYFVDSHDALAELLMVLLAPGCVAYVPEQECYLWVESASTGELAVVRSEGSYMSAVWVGEFDETSDPDLMQDLMNWMARPLMVLQSTVVGFPLNRWSSPRHC